LVPLAWAHLRDSLAFVQKVSHGVVHFWVVSEQKPNLLVFGEHGALVQPPLPHHHPRLSHFSFLFASPSSPLLFSYFFSSIPTCNSFSFCIRCILLLPFVYCVFGLSATTTGTFRLGLQVF